MKQSHDTLDIEIRSLLEARRVTEAIGRLENAALQAGSSTAIDELREIARRYEYLSHYALDGMADPTRDSQLADIMAALYALAVSLRREMMVAAAPTLYFGTVRTQRLRPNPDAFRSAADRYRSLTADITTVMMAGATDSELRREAEAVEKEIFNLLWTTYPLRKPDTQLIRELTADETLPIHFKQLLVGALFLGLDGWLDEQRMILLADIYESAREEVSLRALTALVTALWLHRDSLFSSRFAVRMAALGDTCPNLPADIREIVMQLIRTRDTDRITRKITDEVIPEMMKLRPDIEKSMNSRSPEQMLDPEANPEWEEMLEKSGVADRLRELQEMQEEGADVMMSTFGRLKTFPFFNDPANWFMPFHATHTIASASGAPDALSALIEATPMFCDNDKYSFILSVGQIPETQRRMMQGQIEASVSQFEMMRQTDTLTAADRRRNIIRNFTRDLYRFFKLFRRKGEFTDPFVRPINPAKIPMTGTMLDDDGLLSLIGQFYFRNRYWQEARDIFDRYATLYGSTTELFQKSGYALQQLGLHTEALESFRRSEMLGDDSKWLLRRMAVSLKALGQHAQALDCLQRLESLDPDDIQLALNIGKTLMKLGRHDEALKYFYKVDYSRPGKADRLMAWSTFMTGDYDRSAGLWERILAASPTAGDFMNAGHLAMVRGNFREAARLYSASIAAREFNREKFMIDFATDRDVLIGKGVSPVMEGIVLDEADRLSRTLGSQL